MFVFVGSAKTASKVLRCLLFMLALYASSLILASRMHQTDLPLTFQSDLKIEEVRKAGRKQHPALIFIRTDQQLYRCRGCLPTERLLYRKTSLTQVFAM